MSHKFTVGEYTTRDGRKALVACVRESVSARHLFERAQSAESAALLALLNAVAMMALALAAAFLDVPAWTWRFVAAGVIFFLLMLWLARRADNLRKAATRSETLRRELQLRICAKS